MRRTITMDLKLGSGVLLCFAAVTLAADKKFIELGWDIPDTAFLRAHHRQMEQETSFDGVIFRVEATNGAGKRVTTQAGWHGEPWKQEWFHGALADLKSCQFSNFTDNFVLFNATPKLVSWDDDAGWAALAEKARLCAWLAREGGARGLALDVEPYGQNQWKFDPIKGLTFEATARLARQRGAQFTRGIAKEKPDVVLLTLFLNSVVLRAGRVDDPAAVLAQEHYGLLPAFLNGILDAAPPSMVVVDGCENGYYMDSVEAYQRAALDMRSWNGAAIKLVAPENRAKYRQQVQAGFGFYLDMFVNEPGHTYYRPPLDGSRLKRLSRNLRAARDAADEYVWIYGEQCRWWSALGKDKPWREEQLKKTAGQGRLWDEALPGVIRSIAWARDMDAAARAEITALKKRGAATNLIINADFQAKPQTDAALPPGWTAWQNEKEPTGRFALDTQVGKGSARAAKVAWGCFIQKIKASPGEVFVAQADCLTKGSSVPSLTIRWQTADDKWIHEVDDRKFTFRAGQGDWQRAFGVVTVPVDARQVVLLLDVHGQKTDADVCWFDNVEAHRIDDVNF